MNSTQTDRSSPGRSSIPFADPADGSLLEQDGDKWVNPNSGNVLAELIAGIPRFVKPEDDYAESFGFQWNTWENTLSEQRGSPLPVREILRKRTKFDCYETVGKTLLECGMGGGDDTESLLAYPFSEVHSFDLSRAVDRAARHLSDPRLTITQSSIFDIPYRDESFDFVFCHRVLQHTPDPPRALRCICRKVKPGGVLFAHSYKRSLAYMWEWRYKYRWLTTRVPRSWIYRYVKACGPALHHLNNVLYRIPVVKQLAYGFIPFYHVPPTSDVDKHIELEQLITFDALTPRYDAPMTSRTFRGVIESEGFEIEHIWDPWGSPIYCTAVKRGR